MSYKFERPNRLPSEIRRTAAERLDDALAQLSNGIAGDPAEAVHEARKDLKKTRSLLRLVRENLHDDSYRAETSRLRAAAHTLGGAREADAMVEALAALIEGAAGRMAPACLEGSRRWLEQLRASPRGEADVSEASELIRRSRDDAWLWPLAGESWELIEPGLRRAYRTGRNAFGALGPEPSDEAVHEWRKRVKDLWYHLRLLQEAWPEGLKALAGEAHVLSEHLGDHHDLAELGTTIESGRVNLSDEARSELLTHVVRRQAALIDDATPLGRRVYAESPRRFTQRLEVYWRAWEDERA